MPLEVRISINDRPIETYRIGRLTGVARPESINTYAVWTGEEQPTNQQWLDAPRVVHRYGDGAEILVAKALTEIYLDLEKGEESNVGQENIQH